jgi:hypothetical protein
MFDRIRIPVVVLLVLGSVLCAVWAAQNTGSSPEQKAKCDKAYDSCYARCGRVYSTPDRVIACRMRCYDTMTSCYGNMGISTPPRARLPEGLVPQGTLTQASPTVAPTRVRQPQGTLTQASPTASPNKILSATPKKLQPQGTLTQASPAPTQRPRNVHHDQKKEKKN